MVGTVPVGGDAPISVQTMTNTPTTDVSATLAQINAAAEAGAELAFTYQMEGFGKRLRPLAESVGAELMVECDVAEEGGVAGAARRRLAPTPEEEGKEDDDAAPASSRGAPGSGRT